MGLGPSQAFQSSNAMQISPLLYRPGTSADAETKKLEEEQPPKETGPDKDLGEKEGGTTKKAEEVEGKPEEEKKEEGKPEEEVEGTPGEEKKPSDESATPAKKGASDQVEVGSIHPSEQGVSQPMVLMKRRQRDSFFCVSLTAVFCA